MSDTDTRRGGDSDETDSLFGSGGSDAELPSDDDEPAATIAPSIPGLFVFPRLIPPDVESKLMQEIAKSAIFCAGERNQAMFFTSAKGTAKAASGLPTYLQQLSTTLESLLTPHLPPSTTTLLFHPSTDTATSRQIILNLYRPGEGISPHVDLPGRYADGIMGVCLGSGCVMDFERCAAVFDDGPSSWEVKGDTRRKYSVYMPARTVYCMTGPARWSWAHGIPSRDRDLVDVDGKVETMLRDVRISVTLRWMKPGAEVLR